MPGLPLAQATAGDSRPAPGRGHSPPARARGRVDAFALARLGVPVARATYGSALEAAERALRLLGHRPFHARTIVHRFREHDEAPFAAQLAVLDDEEKLRAVPSASREQLERLLQDDADDIARARRAGGRVEW